MLGMVHSVLINNNYTQLISLICVKLILISSSIVSAKRFDLSRHKWVFISIGIYFFVGIGFDALLLISKLKYDNKITIDTYII
jgi:hypothetical protein